MTNLQTVDPIQNYKPEMGEAKPPADCESRLAHSGGYLVTTNLKIKLVQGIKPASTHRKGLNKYKVTEKGLDKLIKQGYTFSHEVLFS